MTDRLVLTRLLNATEKGQTRYINNKTLGTMPAGSWTACQCGFRTVCGFREFRFLGRLRKMRKIFLSKQN